MVKRKDTEEIKDMPASDPKNVRVSRRRAVITKKGAIKEPGQVVTAADFENGEDDIRALKKRGALY